MRKYATLNAAFPTGIQFDGATKTKVNLFVGQVRAAAGESAAADVSTKIQEFANATVKAAWDYPDGAIIDKSYANLPASYIMHRPAEAQRALDNLKAAADAAMSASVMWRVTERADFATLLDELERYCWKAARIAKFVEF